MKRPISPEDQRLIDTTVELSRASSLAADALIAFIMAPETSCPELQSAINNMMDAQAQLHLAKLAVEKAFTAALRPHLGLN